MQTTHIIKVNEQEEREKLLNELKTNGYKLIEFDESEIISSILPIIVDTENKTISRMGNITCAAAYASRNEYEDIETFWNEWKK